ncbi:hypothetical protein PR048_026824 [Dryococelus australis]|uniref:Uncharacterized protein n=1 Tax=Dryococelus australis TaxID=614101 RepID=A0ABQ9GMD7_9NEOP|nr:hypothetical protein PR048_026824 [Dryococelus australis]
MPIISIRFGSQKTVTLKDNISPNKRAKETKLKFTNDTVRAFVSANIPLQKFDHPAIREWLNEHIKCSAYLGSCLNSAEAGDLPNATTLRFLYMNMLKMEEEYEIKEAVNDQAIVILCDETTNGKGECVFVVLLRILLASEHKMHVAGAKVLNNAN